MYSSFLDLASLSSPRGEQPTASTQPSATLPSVQEGREGCIRARVKATKASAVRKELALKKRKRFADEVLAVFRKSQGLRLRVGCGDHRFIGIWFVLVEDRIFVRSWSVKSNGWHRAFLKEPRGTIQVGAMEISVRAVPIRGKRLRDVVDRAYLDKYNTAGALKYAKDLALLRSRATTTELVPL